MSSSFLQLAVESRDLSQTEKEISVYKAKEIHKMTTFFTHDNSKWSWVKEVVILSEKQLSFWEFAHLCKLLFLFQLEIQQPTEEK